MALRKSTRQKRLRPGYVEAAVQQSFTRTVPPDLKRLGQVDEGIETNASRQHLPFSSFLKPCHYQTCLGSSIPLTRPVLEQVKGAET
ncbi:hypothetical protein ACRALDRAFT_2023460 [Sodiomyces alcalophilus JCM 7366]|uniref:uncharacterized protein n=1 Tax=Sodiomyces alcalophilus JCM 7366 TaxID=591952 RepID=UPI0039B6C9C7